MGLNKLWINYVSACNCVLILKYLSGDEVVEGVGVSQISGQNESLPAATLQGVADTKQSVTEGGIHLDG